MCWFVRGEHYKPIYHAAAAAEDKKTVMAMVHNVWEEGLLSTLYMNVYTVYTLYE